MNLDLQVGDVSRFGERTSVYDGRIVKLELSANCNAHCVFCAMFRSPFKPHGFLSLENAKRFAGLNADWFNAEEWLLEPFFNGESLLNPKVFEILDVLVESSIQLGDLDTNLGLEVDVPRLAAYRWRSLTVNIGGVTRSVHEGTMGTDFALVKRNLSALMAENHGDYPVYVKMNPTKGNIGEIPLLSKFCAEIGPGLRWKAQQTGFPVPADFSPDDQADFLSSVYDSRAAEYFRFSVSEGCLLPKNLRCIYQLPCVCHDGDVTICAHDQLQHVRCGNAFRTPMEEIMASSFYRECQRKGRNRELCFCQGCN